MAKIERGQFSDLLRRYLGMAGTSDVSNELAPELSPGLTLESERPEWEFLKNQKLMALANSQAKDAANISSFRLRNPTASGVVAIFSFFDVSLDGASGVQLTLGAETPGVDLTTVVGTTPRETRYGVGAVAPVSALVASRGNETAGGFVWAQAAIAANTPWQLYTPVVLTPGFQLNVSTTANNIALVFTAHWLEKRIDALER